MDKNRHARILIRLAASICAVGVILGAFGAHALTGAVAEWYDAETARRKLESWNTGVRYMLFHGMALLWFAFFVQTWGRTFTSKWVPVLFLTSIAIFSGGLFCWVFTDIKIFVLAVPIGGFGFIAGWVVTAIFAIPDSSGRSPEQTA